ncbi:hypothetical protein ACWEQL_14200 [Kitasatospora sp. NPDC004240]
MAGTTAVPGSPDPTHDGAPATPRNPYEEHTPGPAALYEPPGPYDAPPLPAPSTGWTVTGMPAVTLPPPPPTAPATPAVPPAPVPSTATPLPFVVPGGAAGASPFGAGSRGRILVVEGGYGNAGRRTWGRGGPSQAPVLSAMLAAVQPQVLLAAESVDAVHLPGASDPHTVLAHLRAAARHPGPLLIHLGGHLLADKRGGQLHLTLRDSKPGSVRQDGLAWQAVAAELRHRPADWQTLVIADLSADPQALPLLQGTVSPLTEGVPLWAVVSPDPEQIGTFTRALIEALHGGRPGGEPVLAPEQLRQQVYSVLRPDVVILATHAPDRPIFRNTARRADGLVLDNVPFEGPRPGAARPRPAGPGAPAGPVGTGGPSGPGAPGSTGTTAPPPAGAPAVRLDKPSAPPAAPVAPAPAAAPGPVVPVSLVKAGVPATPPRPARPVSLLKAGDRRPEDAVPVADAVPEPAQEPPVDAVPVADALPEDAAPAEALPEDASPRPKVVLAKEPPRDAVPEDAVPEDTAAEPEEASPEAAPAPEDTAPAAEPEAPADPMAAYRDTIGRIVRSADAGDHAAAADLAYALELEAIGEHGAVSAPVLQVRQVRAHVCRLAGRLAEAADIYREVALTLLRAKGADDPETQQAATNAEACWRAIPDRTQALGLAPEIIELRAYLPGPEGRKLRAAERHLAQLAAADRG